MRVSRLRAVNIGSNLALPSSGYENPWLIMSYYLYREYVRLTVRSWSGVRVVLRCWSCATGVEFPNTESQTHGQRHSIVVKVSKKSTLHSPFWYQDVIAWVKGTDWQWKFSALRLPWHKKPIFCPSHRMVLEVGLVSWLIANIEWTTHIRISKVIGGSNRGLSRTWKLASGSGYTVWHSHM